MSLRFPCRAVSRCAMICLALTAATSVGAQQLARDQRPITLKQAIDLALQQGYQVRAAEAARDASRYRGNVFYSRLLPQLSLGGTVPAYNQSIIQVVQPDGSTLFRTQNQTNTALTGTLSQALPFTGGNLSVSSSLSRLTVSGAQDVLTWSSTPVSVTLQQPLFRPNTIGWDRREQPVRTELADRQFLEAREDIALQITSLFFDVYATQVAMETATGNAAVNDTLYTLNNGRYQIGSIGENDLLQSQLALLRARTDLDNVTLNHQRALAALRLGLNLTPDLPLEIVVPASVPIFDADTARAVAEALQHLSVVSDMALQDVQARRRVVEARLNNGFGATLNASYGFNATGGSFSSAYQDLLEARRVTLSIEFPLVQWGARRESVRAAEADRDQTMFTMQAVLDQAAHEARFAALQLSQARSNLALSATADTVAQRRFEVAYNRYLIGRISIDNLFIAQREKDQVRTQYVQALRGYWEAYYMLRRLTLHDFEKDEVIR